MLTPIDQFKDLEPYYFTEEDTLWQTLPNFGKDGLSKFDVAYTGFTHIFVIQMPKWMEEIDAKLSKSFEMMLERASTSFSGSANMTLETADFTDGIAANTLRVATTSTKDTPDITIRCLEMKGILGRRYAEKYIMGMSHPNNGYKTYMGAKTKKSPINETFIFLAVQTDQALETIQDYGIYVNGILTEHDRSHTSWEKGGVSIIEGTEFRFSCTELPKSAATLKVAEDYMRNRRALIDSQMKAEITVDTN